LFNHIRNEHEAFAWSTREAKKVMGAKAFLAIKEMKQHSVIVDYPVLFERKGELVAQFKFSVLILANKTERLNVAPLPFVKSEKKIEDAEINEIMARPLQVAKKKKKKKTRRLSKEGVE
jgi:hypothetical protein